MRDNVRDNVSEVAPDSDTQNHLLYEIIACLLADGVLALAGTAAVILTSRDKVPGRNAGGVHGFDVSAWSGLLTSSLDT